MLVYIEPLNLSLIEVGSFLSYMYSVLILDTSNGLKF